MTIITPFMTLTRNLLVQTKLPAVAFTLQRPLFRPNVHCARTFVAVVLFVFLFVYFSLFLSALSTIDFGLKTSLNEEDKHTEMTSNVRSRALTRQKRGYYIINNII